MLVHCVLVPFALVLQLNDTRNAGQICQGALRLIQLHYIIT